MKQALGHWHGTSFVYHNVASLYSRKPREYFVDLLPIEVLAVEPPNTYNLFPADRNP